MKKTLAGILLTLVIGIVILALKIQRVNASGRALELVLDDFVES